MLKLSDFDYSLPKELIAQYPLRMRDSARLLVLHRKKCSIEHCIFSDITRFLDKNDLLVLNDTKVLPSRLEGRRITGGRTEFLLLKRKRGKTFEALIKPGRLRIGEEIIFNGKSIKGMITARDEITFQAKDIDAIYKLGLMPLPPYIKRRPQDLDKVYYQTVYAKKPGAVASPTAGLHFTDRLLKKIKAGGVNLAYITLHVGLGTFRPVKCNDVTGHKMEPEYFKISEACIKLLDKTRRNKGRVIAVGTTSLRSLESYGRGIKEGFTDLFIYPGYKFKVADCLLTNFHLPRTTLFMLVCAFCAAGASASGRAGEKLAKIAYQEAIKQQYMFYSYGDAMLIV